jgi:hypothetical protein
VQHDEIERIVDHYQNPIRGNRVFLAIDARLFDQCGAEHYRNFGSEYLGFCLAKLIGNDEAKKLLASSGRPCVIECGLPVTMFDVTTLGSLLFNSMGGVVETRMCGLATPSFLDFTLDPPFVPPEQIDRFNYSQ